MQTKSANQIRDEYIERSSRNLRIVEGLKTNEAFGLVLEDQLENIRKIDACWQFVPKTEEKRLDDLRIAKMAGLTIVNLISSYTNDMMACQRAIKEIEDGYEGTDDGE